MKAWSAIVVAIALAALFLAGFAYADDSPPPLVAPVAQDAGTVPYPDAASGEAIVVVELLVSNAGYVRDAHIISGDDPFAAAALSAAYGWTFTPAHRGETNVAARIRMRVEFHPPEVLPPPLDAGSSSADAATQDAGAPKSGVEEVIVHGKRLEVGGTRMGGGEVRQMPGAFGDAFRAIEVLPGVTPIVSGLPFFFVRGAPPGNTGYFLDGIRVPLLYHLALGPSVVHPGLIESVEFYPGGYPARYGRYAGGILDGQTLPPARKLHGEANIRLFDAGALLEFPLLDGRLTVLAAGRYSYTAAIVQLVAKDTRVAYWDYQTRIAYKLAPHDRISLFWFGSFDEIDTRSRHRQLDGNEDVVGPFYPLFKTEFHRADLRYDHDTSGGHVRLAATLGLEDSIAGNSATESSQVYAKTLGLRVEGEERATDVLKMRYGADVLLDHYSVTNNVAGGFSDARSLYPDRDDVVIGVRADGIWKANKRVEVVPGLRFDLFTSRPASGQSAPRFGLFSDSLMRATAIVGVDPRLATRVSVNARTTWITTFGVSHQPPSLPVPVPGLQLGRLNTGLQTSLQASQGVEVKLPLEFTATATVFLHDYLGLTDATATCLDSGSGFGDGIKSSCLDQRVRGRAIGLELLIKRDLTKRFTGWLSYTLSRSTRETQGLVVTGRGDFGQLRSSRWMEIPSEFDRTHVLNVMGAFDLGAGWRAGARFMMYTGRPYSKTINGFPVPPFNEERLPPFFRVDVRLEKRWRVFKTGSIAFVIEGMNVTLTKEAIGVQCTTSGSPGSYTSSCEPVYLGPVSVPSIGVEGSL